MMSCINILFWLEMHAYGKIFVTVQKISYVIPEPEPYEKKAKLIDGNDLHKKADSVTQIPIPPVPEERRHL
jgi:hypothetical protein